MSWSKPSVRQVREASEIYLKIAYAGSSPPSAVRDRLASLHATAEEDFYDSPVFERDAARPPTRFALRLGNRTYPHMKLVIERTPDGRGYLFRADTHDKHVRPPPNSREARLFAELMKVNQKYAEEIEAVWAERGIATFKQYLREDLARRVADPARQPSTEAHTSTPPASS